MHTPHTQLSRYQHTEWCPECLAGSPCRKHALPPSSGSVWHSRPYLSIVLSSSAWDGSSAPTECGEKVKRDEESNIKKKKKKNLKAWGQFEKQMLTAPGGHYATIGLNSKMQLPALKHALPSANLIWKIPVGNIWERRRRCGIDRRQHDDLCTTN